jgi:hypothetical protein
MPSNTKNRLGPTGSIKKKETGSVKIKTDDNRRDLNAPYTLVYPNPLKMSVYDGVYKKQFGDMKLLENPGSGKNNNLVWYYYDPVNGVPYDPLINKNEPTIAGNKVDVINNIFSLSGDPRSTELNPYLYVCVNKNKVLRTKQNDNGTFQTIKLDVVSVIGHDGKKYVIKFTGGGGNGQPIYYFTLHFNYITGSFEKWYGQFAPYVQTPPPSPSGSQRSAKFGKRKSSKKVKRSLRSLKGDLKKILKM